MKITKVESVPVDRFLFVKIYTDEGIVGYGESGAWGFLEPSASAIDKFGRYLVGEDPLTIEHHWQYMYRFSHFRGAAIMGALSAIDIALWDIMGKYFGVPVHQLLGGKTRDRARVYYHVFGSTKEELIDGVKNYVNGTIEDCYNKFDVFLIDTCMSTAFANIAATNKPIVYFDIGLDNLTPLGDEKIKLRCLYFKINYKNPPDLKSLLYSANLKHCRNEYTETFSLSSNITKSRHEIMLDLVQTICL